MVAAMLGDGWLPFPGGRPDHREAPCGPKGFDPQVYPPYSIRGWQAVSGLPPSLRKVSTTPRRTEISGEKCKAFFSIKTDIKGQGPGTAKGARTASSRLSVDNLRREKYEWAKPFRNSTLQQTVRD